MSDYISFVYSAISKPNGDALSDGKQLASECLKNLAKDSSDNFPPKLLILLVSAAYLESHDPKELLKGIRETFQNCNKSTPLIGSSVAAVFFKKKIHDRGMILMCLASQLVDIEVSCGKNARKDPKGAIKELLSSFGFSSNKIDPNPLANKLIITFLPGCNRSFKNVQFYPAPELHDLLYRGVNARIMLAGGVCSANDKNRTRDGFQFFNQEALHDSVVAARITTGVPIGVGLNDALTGTGKILTVGKIRTKNKRIIDQFRDSNSSPQTKLGEMGALAGDLMFAKMTSDDERILDLPLPEDHVGSIGLLRQTEEGDHFEVVKPKKDLAKVFRNGINLSKGRVYIKKPIASLLFPCKSYWRFHKRNLLNIENAIAQTERSQASPCIGGFFDGEIGVDERGRSHLSNGSISYVTFGDEMRERTPLYEGVSALANLGPQFFGESGGKEDLIDKSINTALEIIDDTGFPGAMISLVLSNLDRSEDKDKEFIVEKHIGPRFSKFLRPTFHAQSGRDVRDIVFRSAKAVFVPDSIDYTKRNRATIGPSDVLSQYVLPLKRLDGTVFGILQVDLGDLRHLTDDDFHQTEKARVLDCFGEVFGAGLNRIASVNETTIMQGIDAALKDAMSAMRLQDGLKKFVEGLKRTFPIEMIHLWLTDLDERSGDSKSPDLFLEAGLGKFFENSRNSLRKKRADRDAPVYLAFNGDGPHVINDLKGDPVWKKKITSSDGRVRFKELLEIKSYAAIGFKGEDNKIIGVISLGSTTKWFFLKFHQNAMKILADGLHFLVEYLKTKVHHNFLLAVSPQLTKRNLKDTQKILDDVTNTFRKALEADVASLYLWDRDKEKYVLRAGSNWYDAKWIHAASYGNDSGWIGLKTEENIPFHEPDLYKYYQNQKYSYPGGRYAGYIFGQSLSKSFTVEAIGLPLQIGPKKTDKFGMLTLYRRIEKGQASGFVTKDIALLQEGAYQAAGLIRAVLQHRDDEWEKNEHKRRQRVYKAINLAEQGVLFEGNVCRSVLRSYEASEVVFYGMESSKSRQDKKAFWIAGYGSGGKGQAPQLLTENANFGAIITDALGSARSAIIEDRYESNETDYRHPSRLMCEGLVKEVYIPLMSDDELIAALVIRWDLDTSEPFFNRARLNLRLLRVLGRTIGSRYGRHRLMKVGDQTTLALRATAAYAVQRAHLLRGTVQEIYDFSRNFKAGNGHIETLVPLVKTAMNIVKETTILGERVLYPSFSKVRVSEMIAQVFGESNSYLKEKYANLLGIEEPVSFLMDPMLRIDPSHTRDALFNLFDNAADSILRKRKEKHTSEAASIKVEVYSEENQMTKIIISDNGIGMTREEIFNAERGFVATEAHSGVGVLLALVLLAAQGGSLKYESEKLIGTKTIITLPTAEVGAII